MDGQGKSWHYSCMTPRPQIPVFTLFGETSAFPDVIHCERIWDRARLHDWVIQAHRHHAMCQVFFMRQGEAKVRLDARESRLTDGAFLYVPAGIVHGFQFRRGCEGLVLSFPSPVVAGIAQSSAALSRALGAPFSGPMPAFSEVLANRLEQEFAGSGAFRASQLVALSHGLLSDLAASRPEGRQTTPSDRRMQAFQAQIADPASKGWRLTEHARALGITPGHLNRICRAVTGQSASRHLETALMTEAARLLAFTRLGAAEIGFQLGYDDPSYFSRRFRNLLGESPTAYRKRIAG